MKKIAFSLNVTVENTYKKEDEITLKRHKRKSFIKANGIKNYEFNFNKEFNKYLFLCGEKISIIRWWFGLHDNDKFYTYEEWETSIKTKYSVYSIKALEQFYKYLNHCQRKVQPHKEFINPYISALFAFIIGFGVNTLSGIDIIDEQVIARIWLVFIIIIFSFVIKIGIRLFTNKNITYDFYSDYKEIIDNIIKEKLNE